MDEVFIGDSAASFQVEHAGKISLKDGFEYDGLESEDKEIADVERASSTGSKEKAMPLQPFSKPHSPIVIKVPEIDKVNHSS